VINLNLILEGIKTERCTSLLEWCVPSQAQQGLVLMSFFFIDIFLSGGYQHYREALLSSTNWRGKHSGCGLEVLHYRGNRKGRHNV
jgi:hypothetical protein